MSRLLIAVALFGLGVGSGAAQTIPSGGGTVSGNTNGDSATHTPACDPGSPSEPEVVYSWTTPSQDSVATIHVSGGTTPGGAAFRPAVYLMTSPTGGESLACDVAMVSTAL